MAQLSHPLKLRGIQQYPLFLLISLRYLHHSIHGLVGATKTNAHQIAPQYQSRHKQYFPHPILCLEEIETLEHPFPLPSNEYPRCHEE